MGDRRAGPFDSGLLGRSGDVEQCCIWGLPVNRLGWETAEQRQDLKQGAAMVHAARREPVKRDIVRKSRRLKGDLASLTTELYLPLPGPQEIATRAPHSP